MQRHELEPVSLLAGLAFTVIAGCYLVAHATDAHLRWLAVLPAGLIALGITAVGIAARRARRDACPPPPGDVE